ncbi:hypothetical protein [Pseudomarimonas salicorniae]|uniref:Uncharacterized protein n=1 Tax=Pseudomarimonas salicorniae TaxID=2933270 RepID=A0ABT0GKJ3_9GAMM|nr:hypothetical protein [Lysobacter sp. CAU 1642]MCK7595061.1 hypothetical protein [Lysobacter sp. CAU 1642]
MRPIAQALLLLVAASPAAALEGIAYRGDARSLEGDTVLYTEHHVLRQEAGVPVERFVVYRCPDGNAFARKHVRYGEPPYAPQFDQQDARFGYQEGFSRGKIAGSIYVRRSSDAPREEDSISLGESLVVDAGFDEFVRAQWDRLQAGKAVPLRFVVPSRLAAYGFKVRKVGEEQLFGDSVSNFQLAVSGLLGWFADPIDVSYRNSDRRLTRFAGLSNIRRTPEENLSVRIEFPPSQEQALDEDTWKAAQETPIGACQLGG